MYTIVEVGESRDHRRGFWCAKTFLRGDVRGVTMGALLCGMPDDTLCWLSRYWPYKFHLSSPKPFCTKHSPKKKRCCTSIFLLNQISSTPLLSFALHVFVPFLLVQFPQSNIQNRETDRFLSCGKGNDDGRWRRNGKKCFFFFLKYYCWISCSTRSNGEEKEGNLW